MKLLAATDIHGATDTFARILAAAPADVILLGGDLTHFGSPDDAQAVVRLAQATGAKVLAVAGNCDSALIDARLDELDVGLLGRGVLHGNVGFVGLSAMPPWLPRMYHFSEAELGEFLDAGHGQVSQAERLVVLSHAPPRGTLDRVFLARHVGSTALGEFVDRIQPPLVVCGHIHEARGVAERGRTTVVNCGAAAKGFFAVIELAEGRNSQVELCRA
ncbi:MAG: metallophosphoesterase family protein [Pirellulales bacterium]|nr:metallophosphoesterase family protein [Pirellulales bacterium]